MFGASLLIVLFVMFFFVPNPTAFQRGLARFFLALSAGFFAFFFVGGVVLSGGWRGLTIGAAGGFALFVAIQFFVDPFPVAPGGPGAELREWKGGRRLGSLIETLRAKRLTGEVEEQVKVAPQQRTEIENLKTDFEIVSGRNWAEVFERICSAIGCLRCDVSADRKTIGLSLGGEVERHESLYVCK